MSVEEYQRRFPKAPILSEYAKKALAEYEQKQEEKEAEAASMLGKTPFHDVFKLNKRDANTLSTKRKPIPITVLDKPDTSDPANTLATEASLLIPEVNNDYIFDVVELKKVMSGVEMNIPVYIWGHKGAGKTELVEQICARTNRPLMRVQHTVNTEESQIVGQWVVRNGATEFELGPLPMAMLNGWAYLADEYDFAMPSVLATYQAVLEGKPLTIKEAPVSMRVIRPHKNFRFFATGNTNGTGDESGLYQGTTIQNSANYDRFGLVIRKAYMSEEDESKILCQNAKVSEKDAQDLVRFAASVRESFDAGKISDTISPRTLLFAAKLGIAHASFATGLELAFFNKLNAVDKKACEGYAQRIFGV
ncbi:MAG: MoxR family ATPase [Sutterellaceae bacterium]|nr:MoxR family ATPase [Sutterellaceae bacterium]